MFTLYWSLVGNLSLVPCGYYGLSKLAKEMSTTVPSGLGDHVIQSLSMRPAIGTRYLDIVNTSVDGELDAMEEST
jgi:hypothetical protein